MDSTSSAAAARVDRTPINLAVALLSLAGVAAIWLHFAWNTSPAAALTDDDLWYLAAPFLLAVPIAAAWIWALLKGSLPHGALRAARVLAGCAMAPTALFYVRVVREGNWPGSTATEWIAFGAPILLAAGWVFVTIHWRPERRTTGAEETVALMEAAFLPNAAMCLLGFADNRESGWYVSLAVSAAFAAHVAATLRRSFRTRPQPRPAPREAQAGDARA